MLFSTAALRNASRIGLRRFPTAQPSAIKSNGGSLQNQLRTKASASGGIPAPLLQSWYKIFGHSTIGYATWLVAGIIVAEGMTGALTDGVWNMANSGRTYETVDWSKFATDDDDDEDEDEEEEEEDDEEEEEDDDE
ncbi:hypothetical protein ACHAXT_006118 [Thalassiosira profunda]